MSDLPLSGNNLSSHSSSIWNFFGKSLPRTEIVFFTQVLLIYIVVITCIVNLTVNDDTKTQLWTALLAACLGYLLPNPSLNIGNIANNNNKRAS